MSTIHDLNTRNFLRNLSTCDNSFFLTPWAGVILRNCDASGELIEHSTTQSYIQSKVSFWLFLSLKLFKANQGSIFGAFICPACESMSSVSTMTMDQSREDIESLLCLHSVAAAQRTGDWRDIWGLPAIDNDILSHKFEVGLDTKVKILLEDDLFLVAVQSGGFVYLIFTLSKKNKSPFCSKCSMQKCKHYKQYVSYKNDQHNENVTSDNESNQSIDSLRSGSDAGTRKAQVDHYNELEPIEEYIKRYGYNLTNIVYPFTMDPDTRENWISRLNGEHHLPDEIIPEFIEGFECQHGSTYDPNDVNLVVFSSNVIIYTETSEKVYPVKTYARKTVGSCKCKQQAGTHKLLLWHLGRGKMIDYTFLSGYMQNMRCNGTSKGSFQI